jgi:predicted PurR-regulated permease PerM
MARTVSLVVLLVILLVLAVLFYEVIAPFILPMFVALVLTVVFRPLYQWVKAKCKGRDRLAGALTTVAVLLIVLLPLALIIFQAATEGYRIYRHTAEARSDLPPSGAGSKQDAADARLENDVANYLARFSGNFGMPMTAEEIEKAAEEKFREWVGPVVRVTAQFAGALLLGLAVTSISLYYFLVDGPVILTALQQLVPLDRRQVDELVTRFDSMCRAVVSAILVAAVAQGILVGVGLYIARVDMVFLLALLTMLLSVVPMVGSTLVWGPVCLWLFFQADRPTAAVVLAIYCTVIVVVVENVVKPMVLHGQSNMHPLLAFLSVLGGASAMGPIGIFVGPMVVAFLQTLLKMLQLELKRMGEKPLVPSS